jgi:2-isopropylmalate synthase
VIAVFGKASMFQVRQTLKISPEENLHLIERTVRHLKSRSEEVLFDAEHFFDGYGGDPEYALAALKAAEAGGADWLVLCDTNGGTMPDRVREIVAAARNRTALPLGIHAHNDADLAVANSIEAARAGAGMVQGTVNGYGERCGNANLVSIIPTLELKMGLPCLPPGRLGLLTKVSRTIDEIANRNPLEHQPYVGRSAFAHKGGVHANAVMKDPRTYEHVEPESVGNRQRVIVSDLSGRSSVLMKARELGIELDPDAPATMKVLDRLKELENEGYQFEGADASFKLLVDRLAGRHPNYFTLHKIDVNIDIKQEDQSGLFNLDTAATASITLEVGDVHAQTKASGDGPVNAIDNALRKLIDKFYPSLKEVSLLDYKVRVLNGGKATASVVRVLIRSGDGKDDWGTVGVSSNIIEASWQAMVDALEYKLVKDNVPPHV